MGAEPVTDGQALRCAVLARALDEPLAGTAPVATRWLCVERPGAWPRDVAAHRDPVVQTLHLRAAATGWRLLLIRPPGRRVGPSRTQVFLADTAPAHPRVTTLTLTPLELAQLRLPAADEPLPGSAVTEPLLLVCTHGRRDRCCALDGRALVNAVTAGCPEVAPHVWESSHLGGHRFAPTALVLPTGYLYGRLDPATAIDVHKAAAHGEMEPLLCRGRSTWSPAGQVAELAVRRDTGLRDAAALHVEPLDTLVASGRERREATTSDTLVASARERREATTSDTLVASARERREATTSDTLVASARERREATTSVTVLVRATDGRCWHVLIEQVEPTGARPTTCGADPAPIAALRAVEVRVVAPSGQRV